MDHDSFAAEADYSSTGETLDDLFLDSFTSAHSSGASDGGPGGGAGDYSFESDLMGSYLADAGQLGAGASGGGYASDGQQGYTSSSSASSAAELSAINSPDYSSYAALAGTNANFESLATGTSPPFSFGATVDAGHSNDLHQQHNALEPRSHASQSSSKSNYYGSATSIHQQAVQQQYLPNAPLHHQITPTQIVHQSPLNPFTHYTPQHSANSLSPLSSASSSSGAYQNVYPSAVQSASGVGGEASLARMMADAEAQGRSQAEAHAVYASSFMASLAQAQAAPRHPYSSTADNQNQALGYHNSSSFPTTYPQQPFEDRQDGADQLKKRRVSTTEDFSAHQTRAQHKSRGATSGGRRAVSASHPPPPQSRAQQHPLQFVGGPSQAGFHFALNASVANTAGSIASALSAVPRHAATSSEVSSSLNLIANAGVPTIAHRDGPPPRTYQSIAPAAVMPVVSPPPALSASAAKAGKRVAEKAGVKKPTGGEKRKKGEKGHNAVERRYRNNINNHLAALRDAIPALRHLKPLPSMPASRRRASQFTLSTAAQGPTPEGLVDGVLAAKTLSKGSILGKSIEYIHYLQGARADGNEDIELLKSIVREMVGGGQALIDVFDQRRAVREVERSRIREEERKEQERLDEEDGSADENEDDEKAPAVQSFVSQSGLLAPHSGSPHGFPPSPASSSEDPTSISPRLVLQHQHYSGHASAPPRVLLATFMGLSFAGGLGYDWTYSSAAEPEIVGARAWAGRLVRRAAVETSSSATPSAVITSDLIHPSLLSGLVFLGIASILSVVVFVFYPLFVRDQRSAPQPELVKSRGAYRQRRRAQALASLVHLNHEVASAPTYLSECRSALKARRELLKLVGAPTYALLPALCKEGLATLLRKVTTIRVGSFSTWSEEDRIEAAVAWVRIAEIEATVGADEVNYLARCYTFLRLFNLSRSTQWPQATSTTSLPAVDAVLSVHLLSLGQPLSAAALWSTARSRDRKKSDTPLHPYAEVAISTDFALARSILGSTSSAISLDAPARPADTVPLLRISEIRCAAALREAWAKIFVSVIATTCPPQAPLAPLERFPALVDQPFLEETIRHVLESTVEGGASHTLGKVTRSLCSFYAGEKEAGRYLARELERERATGGPAASLRCVEPFLKLVLDLTFSASDEEGPDCSDKQIGNNPIAEVDLLASSTLGWLLVRRQYLLLPTPVSGKVEPQLHEDTLAIRRMLGHDVFRDAALKAFCSPPSANAREVGDGVAEGGLDLEGALDACLDALTSITRRAAGLRAEEDSGVECD